MYRSFTYFYLLSLFICAVLFAHKSSTIPLDNPQQEQKESNTNNKDKFTEEKKEEKKPKPQPKYQLIELLDEDQKPDMGKPIFFGTKASRGKNQSRNANSTYQVQRLSELKKKLHLNEEKESSQSNTSSNNVSYNFLDELADIKKNSSNKTSNNLKKKIKPLDGFDLKSQQSQYLSGKKSVRKINLQMSKDGDFSVNSIDFPGAEYLIKVAKTVFKYWVDFIPGNMIVMGFIKTDNLGMMQSILLFSRKNNNINDYKISFIKPFISNNLNQSTLDAFEYFHFPEDKKIIIQNLAVEFKIYKDTLTVSANFEFQLDN